VRIDTSRSADRTAESKLKLRGSVEGVKAAVASVKAVVDANRKMEEVVQVKLPKQFLSLFLCCAPPQRPTLVPHSSTPQQLTAAFYGLLLPAQVVLASLGLCLLAPSQAFSRHRTPFSRLLTPSHAFSQVESQHVGLLLGKSGATINAIQRESGAVRRCNLDPTMPFRALPWPHRHQGGAE